MALVLTVENGRISGQGPNFSVNAPVMHIGNQLWSEAKDWIYNAFDCTVTSELAPILDQKLLPHHQRVFNFEMACQAPALAMMRRGVRVDPVVVEEMAEFYGRERDRMDVWINRMADAVWGQPLNPRSPIQLQRFFYNSMRLPVQFNFDKGKRKITTNHEALEKLRSISIYAAPIISAIFASKEYGGKQGVLRSGIDPDGRFRTSINVGATETGRWSSSENPHGRGTNSQNITEELRRIFIPDPGMKFGYADLERAESFGVAYLSGDEEYIEACLSHNLHVTVAKMLWPNLGWTSIPEEDKEIAEQTKPYRHWSVYDLSKRGGHASNYLGRAENIARKLGLPKDLMIDFQQRYFRRFSGIPRWHSEVQLELQSTGKLTTPFGRERQFFSRLQDDSTLREAVAFLPQSTIVDALNIGLYRVWHELDFSADLVQALFQIHDALLFQFPEGQHELCGRVEELMTVPVEVRGRTMTIPVGVDVGYRWQKKQMVNWRKGHTQQPIKPRDLLDLRA